MNAKRLIIAAGTALTLSAVLLPATASADNRGYYGPPQGYGYGYGRPGHGHGHYKPWKRGYYGPPGRGYPGAGVRGPLSALCAGAGVRTAASAGVLPAGGQRPHHHLARRLVGRGAALAGPWYSRPTSPAR